MSDTFEKEWNSVWSNEELNQWIAASPDPDPPFYPSTPVIEPHHHLFPDGRKHNPSFDKTRFASVGRSSTTSKYLKEEWTEDIRDVNVAATVYVEARSGYEKALKYPFWGEAAFVRGVVSDGHPSSGAFCRGFVGVVDLLASNEEIREMVKGYHKILEGSGSRMSGIRLSLAHDIRFLCVPRPENIGDYVRGLKIMGNEGLTVDVWIYHSQISELVELATKSPETIFICDHTAMPTGSDDHVFNEWKQAIEGLRALKNVHMKLGRIWPKSPDISRLTITRGCCNIKGGLGTHLCGHSSERPLHTRDIVNRYGIWFKECFRVFGPDRVLFESNFPIDKATTSYASFWSACKILAQQITSDPAGRRQMLFENANRLYKLGLPLPDLELYQFGTASTSS